MPNNRACAVLIPVGGLQDQRQPVPIDVAVRLHVQLTGVGLQPTTDERPQGEVLGETGMATWNIRPQEAGTYRTPDEHITTGT